MSDATASGAVASASGRHEDWSEIEALLATPDASATTAGAPMRRAPPASRVAAATRATPAGRIALGLAAAIVCSGGALGIASLPGCRGDLCAAHDASADKPAAATASPVRVVPIEAPTPSRSADPLRGVDEGRSAAEALPPRRPRQAAAMPRRVVHQPAPAELASAKGASEPLVATRTAALQATAAPRRPAPQIRRQLAQARDAVEVERMSRGATAGAPARPQAMPRAMLRPNARAVALPRRPRLQQVWVSPTRWVLVEVN